MNKRSSVYSFPSTTLLITHYNRSKSLENLLLGFRKLQCVFAEIIVSDDGSSLEHLLVLRNLQKKYSFKLIEAEKNKGLGNNINKGQDAVRTPFTLYVQEDFEPLEIFPEKLVVSHDFMECDATLDIVRYYAFWPYPYLKAYKNGFFQMYVKRLGLDYGKIYCYADTPHLRRTNFLQKFGRYAEGIKGDRTEYKMCISFIQKKGKGLFYYDCNSLFKHENSTEEPSTMDRRSWRQSNNFFIKFLRETYRQLKYNGDILLMKTPKNTI